MAASASPQTAWRVIVKRRYVGSYKGRQINVTARRTKSGVNVWYFWIFRL